MGQRFHQRLRISGMLEAVVPLHVGGDNRNNDPESDLPLACDGRGKPYIPGTALAGPLRTWMERHFDKDENWMKSLWGWQPDQKSTQEGAASRLHMENAVVSLPQAATVELWDGIAIDRQWGVAASGFKYDRMVLPRGSRIPMEILVELPVDTEESKKVQDGLAYLLGTLKNDGIAIGAGGSRGMGQVKLLQAAVRQEEWGSRRGVINLLKAEKLTPTSRVQLDDWLSCKQISLPRRQRMELTLIWKSVGPLMSKSGQDGMGVDMLPMVSTVGDNQVALVIPGSSIKGALRSHAERIIRTLLPDCAKGFEIRDLDDRQHHFLQLDIPLVRAVFGSARQGKGKQTQGQRGSLSVDPVYSQSIPKDKWAAVVAAKDSSALILALRRAGLRGEKNWVDQAFHVAVDRWTGGAADKMLFSAIEPHAMDWDPIRLVLDLGHLDETLRDPARFLLLLLVRDLMAGRLPIGFGVNRGYGTVQVDSVWRPDISPRTDYKSWQTLQESFQESFPVDALDESWKSWIAKEQEHLINQNAPTESGGNGMEQAQ